MSSNFKFENINSSSLLFFSRGSSVAATLRAAGVTRRGTTRGTRLRTGAGTGARTGARARTGATRCQHLEIKKNVSDDLLLLLTNRKKDRVTIIVLVCVFFSVVLISY